MAILRRDKNSIFGFSFNILGSDKGAAQSVSTILGGGFSQYDHMKVAELVEAGFVLNPYIYAVIHNAIISSSQVPWYVYDIKPDVKKDALKLYMNYKSAGEFDRAELLSKAVDIFQGSNEVTKLLEKPNAFMSFPDVFTTCLGVDMLTGNQGLYAPKLKGRLFENTVPELIPLPCQFLKVNADGWKGNVESYDLAMGDGMVVHFEKDEILHIKDFNPGLTRQKDEQGTFHTHFALYGISPLSPLCKVIRQSNDGFTAQMKLLQNGHPLGILSNNSEMPMTAKSFQDAEAALNKTYGGAHNKGKIRLTSAKLQWLQMGMNSADLQLQLLQDANLSTICACYGYPTPNITGENANFNTSKEAEKQKWNDALLPRFNRFRDHLNRFLRERGVLKEGQFIDYDHRAIPSLQQDLEKLNKITMEQMEHGLIDRKVANRVLMIDAPAAEHDDKYLLRTDLRFTDEPLPGQTGQTDKPNGKTKKPGAKAED